VVHIRTFAQRNLLIGGSGLRMCINTDKVKLVTIFAQDARLPRLVMFHALITVGCLKPFMST